MSAGSVRTMATSRGARARRRPSTSLNRAMRTFIVRVKPALTIWYHQPLDVVYGSDPHVSVLKRYARLTGWPYRRLTAPAGRGRAGRPADR